MTAHNYEQQGKNVLLIKPKLDDRFGGGMIGSRTGFKRKADIILDKGDRINYSPNLQWIRIKRGCGRKSTHRKLNDGIDCILVDEAQFITPEQIEDLRLLTLHTPVICYGLRTDYMSKLFPGAKRLMELADAIEEVKTICTYCTKKSVINMKHVNGKVIKTGDGSPDLGCEEKYLPVCWKCWYKQTEDEKNEELKPDTMKKVRVVAQNPKSWKPPMSRDRVENFDGICFFKYLDELNDIAGGNKYHPAWRESRALLLRKLNSY